MLNCQVLTKNHFKKTKHLLVKNELNKLKTFDSSCFTGKSHFKEDGTQNYLVFQPLNKYFKFITNTLSILLWQCKGLSTENFDAPTIILSPSLNYVGNKIGVKFTRTCLKQSNKLTYTHGKIVNIYIVYEIGASISNFNDALKNCLFGAVTLPKDAVIDKYRYSSYAIGFDRRGNFGNEIYIEWCETCKFEYRLDAIVCNNKQRWNNDKCQCECKELIDKGVCDKGYSWNPSIVSVNVINHVGDVGEYLDYENCECRKRLIDKLVYECTETV